MEQDVNYLISRLSKIEGFADTGKKLLGVVKEKKVEPLPEEEKAEEVQAGDENGKGEDSKDASGESPKPDEKSGGNEFEDKGPG